MLFALVINDVRSMSATLVFRRRDENVCLKPENGIPLSPILRQAAEVEWVLPLTWGVGTSPSDLFNLGKPDMQSGGISGLLYRLKQEATSYHKFTMQIYIIMVNDGQ